MSVPIPIVRLTLEGMRQTIEHAFIEHLHERDEDVRTALKAAIDNFDLKKSIRSEINSQLPRVLEEIIGDALRQAIGNNPKVRERITNELAAALTEKLAL